MASDAPIGRDAGSASSIVPAELQVTHGGAVMFSHMTAPPEAVPIDGESMYAEL